MRLKRLHVSGFKSFVDPTTITIPSSIVAVVGPNGCGKSNVLDAVRWVMGESSPRNLRGDSMADVIFNGSSARNPVGKAAVELIFDNSEGKVPGPYGQYAEIAIKRSLTRDGQSDYLINKNKCRRRDITDIFLGTGLGPRSYSIIEQGMVGRIIEAKPEELRAFVEEAAGISKYKERRRDTETRIRHTRENLTRIEDIRSELETQLRRLKRQSQAAKRYKELKQEERLLRAQLGTAHWQKLDTRVMEQDRELARIENDRQSQLAEQRRLEQAIEQARVEHATSQDHVNQVQGELYRVGAEVATIEQRIEHAADSRRQRDLELQRLLETIGELQEQLAQDQGRMHDTRHGLDKILPTLDERQCELAEHATTLDTIERGYHEWQARWERFSEEAATPIQESEVQKSRIVELERHVDRLVRRSTQLNEELHSLEQEADTIDVAALRQNVNQQELICSEGESAIDELDERILEVREAEQEKGVELEELRDQHQELSARLGSLKKLQAAALGSDDERASAWLQSRQLDQAPRVTTKIRVADGWERAVDRVTNGGLAAVCVQDISRYADDTDNLDFDLSLMEAGAASADTASGAGFLLNHVEADGIDLVSILGGVFAVDTVGEALALRRGLKPRQCVVTRSGTIVGSNWINIAGHGDASGGLLGREHEIARLAGELNIVDEQLSASRVEQSERHARLVALEEDRSARRRELGIQISQRTELHNTLGGADARLAQITARCGQVQAELADTESQLNLERAELEAAQRRLKSATKESGSLAGRRSTLLDERDQLRRRLAGARHAVETARSAKHEAELETQRLQSAFDATQDSTLRMQTQLETMVARQAELTTKIDEDDRPEDELRSQLEARLQHRLAVEQRLGEARDKIAQVEEKIAGLDQHRLQFEQNADKLRSALEEGRIGRQELVIRREGFEDQVRDNGFEMQALLKELPDGLDEDELADRLEKVTRRIDRIGPVNLVAIEEFDEQSERKEYLDRQYEDLAQALKILEEIIRKIDRETQARFKQTFDKLNEGFQEFFPKLFGGGSAYLELTSDDLLETGVTVMARPPGKRNSTIHLLSGGEKALTAVALLFALFKLNPAPFCLLDEVDAPLDDANVERYCETLRSLSHRTQLIVITHNKITMEAAQVLIGVTMSEPGVSRLVTVDVDAAVEMAVQ